VPRLPRSPDGTAELARLQAELALARDPETALPLALALASTRGRLEDYQALLARSEAWLAARPGDPAAIKMRITVLGRVHRFGEARALLDQLSADDRAEQTVILDEATGHLDRSGPERARIANAYPSTVNLVGYAGSLAIEGRTDLALAVMRKAAAALGDNAPELISWLLFQWGRVYELAGQPAAARDLFAEAHRRLPGYLEATAHLAQAMAATGDRASAQALVDGELARDRQPELLGLAVQLGHTELAAEATREWERYVAALPEAFADHAARFYLTVTPARALVLARANLANRDTPEARSLTAEAALAAGDPKTACEVADPLVNEPAPRAQKFVAWRALSKCGQADQARRLARDLGIAP
jgi:thioredoxin-like negative regulator of GroEL